MLFSNRSHRFPICCPVTYRVGLREGHGTVWNLSMKGWHLAGDVPLHVGQTCLLMVQLPKQESLSVVATIVRWARDWDQEYGLENVMMNKQTQTQLDQVLTQLEQTSIERIE